MLEKLQNDRGFHLLPLKLQNDKVPLVKKKKKRQFLIQLYRNQVKISNFYNGMYGKIFLTLNPANIPCCSLVVTLCLIFFATSCTVAYQAPLSMGFPRQEYWNGLLFPSPGNLPSPGTKPTSPAPSHLGSPNVFK